MNHFSPRIIVTSLALAASLAALPAHGSSISVNGTCQVGTCSNTDVLPIGGSESSPFSFMYTFANSDRYLLTGMLSTINQPSRFGLSVVDFVTTYLGNGAGTSSRDDVLQMDFLQYVAKSASSVVDGYEEVSGSFGPGLGLASSASARGIFASSSLPLLGPYFAANGKTFSGTANGTLFIPSGTPLLDYRYTLTFGSGSEAGSSIGINPTVPSPTPEPQSLLLLGSGAVALAGMCWQRRRSPLAD